MMGGKPIGASAPAPAAAASTVPDRNDPNPCIAALAIPDLEERLAFLEKPLKAKGGYTCSAPGWSATMHALMVADLKTLIAKAKSDASTTVTVSGTWSGGAGGGRGKAPRKRAKKGGGDSDDDQKMSDSGSSSAAAASSGSGGGGGYSTTPVDIKMYGSGPNEIPPDDVGKPLCTAKERCKRTDTDHFDAEAHPASVKRPYPPAFAPASARRHSGIPASAALVRALTKVAAPAVDAEDEDMPPAKNSAASSGGGSGDATKWPAYAPSHYTPVPGSLESQWLALRASNPNVFTACAAKVKALDAEAKRLYNADEGKSMRRGAKPIRKKPAKSAAAGGGAAHSLLAPFMKPIASMFGGAKKPAAANGSSAAAAAAAPVKWKPFHPQVLKAVTPVRHIIASFLRVCGSKFSRFPPPVLF